VAKASAVTVARVVAVAVARVRAVARAVAVAVVVGGNSDGGGGNTTIAMPLLPLSPLPLLLPSPQLTPLLSSSNGSCGRSFGG
jgi:hypothetical protein